MAESEAPVCPNCGYPGATGCAQMNPTGETKVFLRCHRCGADYDLHGALIALAPGEDDAAEGDADSDG